MITNNSEKVTGYECMRHTHGSQILPSMGKEFTSISYHPKAEKPRSTHKQNKSEENHLLLHPGKAKMT